MKCDLSHLRAPQRASSAVGGRWWAGFFALLGLTITAVTFGQAPQTPTTTQPAPNLNPRMVELAKQADELSRSLKLTIGPPDRLYDPETREMAATNAVSTLKLMLDVSDLMLAEGGPQATETAVVLRRDATTLLCVFGDTETIERVQKLADAPGTEGLVATGQLLYGRWIAAIGSADAQHKVLDDTQKYAEAYPSSGYVTQMVLLMHQARPADQVVRERISRIISTKMTSELAKKVAPQLQASLRLYDLVGKPVTIMDRRFNKEMFSSKIWQGSVVMVIFWSSEDAVSREETALWKRLYQKHHKDGLELVGVSCDADPKAMIRFLQTQRGVIWPQLYNHDQPGWHAMATELGVTELPTLLLIDKHGVLRYVDARTNLEEKVLELLKE